MVHYHENCVIIIERVVLSTGAKLELQTFVIGFVLWYDCLQLDNTDSVVCKR
jgi:hypothetical protein